MINNKQYRHCIALGKNFIGISLLIVMGDKMAILYGVYLHRVMDKVDFVDAIGFVTLKLELE